MPMILADTHTLCDVIETVQEVVEEIVGELVHHYASYDQCFCVCPWGGELGIMGALYNHGTGDWILRVPHEADSGDPIWVVDRRHYFRAFLQKKYDKTLTLSMFNDVMGILALRLSTMKCDWEEVRMGIHNMPGSRFSKLPEFKLLGDPASYIHS